MKNLGSVVPDASGPQIGDPGHRYHFNLRDGDTFIPDNRGADLPGNEAALWHAKQLARGFKWIRWSIDVTDEQGHAIGTIERK